MFLVGISPPEFDNLTLAVIRGRLVRYLMRSKEVSIYCFMMNYGSGSEVDKEEDLVICDTSHLHINFRLPRSFHFGVVDMYGIFAVSAVHYVLPRERTHKIFKH